jgi:hypothetical protein
MLETHLNKCIFQRNTMVVGIDVYHDVEGGNSWVGLVANLNRKFTQYTSHTTEQRGQDREMIDQLVNMLQKAMLAYKKVSSETTSL